MIFRRLYCVLGAAIFALLCLSDTWAAELKMECDEWRGGPAGDFLGSYIFSFDDSGTLNIVRNPAGQNNWLFGTNVKKWTLAWKKDGRAVFYGVDDDLMGPVKILSLDFGKPRMFDYSLSGVAEDANSRSLTRKECHQLN
jgi:hypothetical protein